MDDLKKLETLRAELKSLRRRFEKLGARFVEEGGSIKEPGHPPDPLLLEEAQQASEELHHLAHRIIELSGKLLPTHSTNSYSALEDLQRLLVKLEESVVGRKGMKEKLLQARALVEQSFDVAFPPGAHRERGAFHKKLEHYRQVLSGEVQAAEMRELARRMAEGEHPLNALWQFASEEKMEVQEAADRFQEVAEEFGLLTALAAARGDLFFPWLQEEAFPEREAGWEAPEREGEEKEYEEPAPLDAGVEDKAPVAGQEPGAEPAEVPAAEIRPEPQELDCGKAGAVDPEPETLELFICRMLEEGRLEPAFWLASLAELGRDSFALPPLLITAVDLAGVVKGDGGPAAEWLTYLYDSFEFEALMQEQPTDERKAGMAFMVLASLVRPAVVAPGSGAPQLLSRLYREQSVLKEHCPFLEGAFHKKGDVRAALGWEKELESLSREAQGWEKRNHKLSLASPRAARLWDRLKEEDGLLGRLIRPICQNDTAAAEDVSRLVSYLRHGNNLKIEIARLYRQEQEMGGEEIFHIPGSWQVLVRLEEALRLAERWLKLCHKVSAEKAQSVVLDRHKLPAALRSSIEELKDLAQREWDNAFARSSAVLCRRMLEFLGKELLEGRAPLEEGISMEELASLEVKEKPILKFQPGWKPEEKNVERVGRALLALLQENIAGPVGGSEAASEGQVGAEKESDSGQESTSTPSEGGDLLRDEALNGGIPEEGILSPQERDFIRKVFQDMDEDLFPSGENEDGEAEDHWDSP